MIRSPNPTNVANTFNYSTGDKLGATLLQEPLALLQWHDMPQLVKECNKAALKYPDLINSRNHSASAAVLASKQ